MVTSLRYICEGDGLNCTAHFNKDTDVREDEVRANKFIEYSGGTTIGGNSGSPLVISEKNGELYLVGVHSKGTDYLEEQQKNPQYDIPIEGYGVPAIHVIEMLDKIKEEKGINVPYRVVGPQVSIDGM